MSHHTSFLSSAILNYHSLPDTLSTTTSDELRSEEKEKSGFGSRACLLLHNSNNPYFVAGSSIALVYNKDVVIKKFSSLPVQPHEYHARKDVFEFSEGSRRRLLRLSRNSGHFIKSQVCLTFHNSCPLNGKAFKEILNIFLTRLRKKYPDLYYLWVLEFQTKGESPGQPHAHLFSNIEPSRLNREDVAKLWVTTVSGTESNYKFTSHKNNFFPWVMTSGSYLAKEYIAKSVQKDVPVHFHSVGRFWGASRNMKPTFNVVDESLFHCKSIYTKSVRGALKMYEKTVASYMASQSVDKTRGTKFDRKMSRNRLLSSVPSLNFRSSQRSRTLPNLADSFIKIVKHYWFYGVENTGAVHQVFDVSRCPSFEHGVSF